MEMVPYGVFGIGVGAVVLCITLVLYRQAWIFLHGFAKAYHLICPKLGMVRLSLEPVAFNFDMPSTIASYYLNICTIEQICLIYSASMHAILNYLQ